jgi:pimeloyl-ACP methyl ester carboxylesterase
MFRVVKIILTVILLVAVAGSTYFAIVFSRHNIETKELNDEARRGIPGKFIQLSQGMVHYELAGPPAGRTVVFIHGFSIPYYLWDHNFNALAKAGFRVLRYDLYGRGYSDRPSGPYNARLFDRQLRELIEALKLDDVDLVGASMGGPIAVTFAVRHPEKVRTVSLFAPGYFTNSQLPFELRAPLVSDYTMAVKIAPTLPDSQKEDLVHPEKFPEYVSQYHVQMEFKGFRHALLSTLQNYVTRDRSEDYRRLGLIAKPVLVVWGKLDKDVPFEFSQKVLTDVPQAEFHPLEGEAHAFYYESPEKVNPLLIQFLNERK